MYPFSVQLLCMQLNVPMQPFLPQYSNKLIRLLTYLCITCVDLWKIIRDCRVSIRSAGSDVRSSGSRTSARKFKSPWPWPWPWIGWRSYQHAQYLQDYHHAQPSDCSVTRYRNIAILIAWNIDIRGILNCRDSFHRRKFENCAPTSCRPDPYYHHEP